MTQRILIISLLFLIGSNLKADQFLLFDQVFTFEEKDAVPTKSHLYVKKDQLGEAVPSDWTQPVDYRNGTVHIRIEVLEKPEGDAPTVWSLCYIPNQGRKNNYGCTNTPVYTKPGVYEKTVKMTEFWENDSIVWSKGVKHMSLVIKNSLKGGKGHAHLETDLSKYFPTKVRVSMVQVSKGDAYDASILPKLLQAR
ncbi:MAG: hypothetical protein P1U89_00545 [Verrucomicrobiales bacterium]|nr:hypothetical protein [Verrucomicrobiales bacterium]